MKIYFILGQPLLFLSPFLLNRCLVYVFEQECSDETNQ